MEVKTRGCNMLFCKLHITITITVIVVTYSGPIHDWSYPSSVLKGRGAHRALSFTSVHLLSPDRCWMKGSHCVPTTISTSLKQIRSKPWFHEGDPG